MGNDAITVIYYKKDDIALHSRVFHNLPKGSGGRHILPDEFRDGNLILAVMEGEVKILNRLGDRMFDQEHRDWLDSLDGQRP